MIDIQTFILANPTECVLIALAAFNTLGRIPFIEKRMPPWALEFVRALGPDLQRVIQLTKVK